MSSCIIAERETSSGLSTRERYYIKFFFVLDVVVVVGGSLGVPANLLSGLLTRLDEDTAFIVFSHVIIS